MNKDLLVANRYAEALFHIARMIHKDEEIEAELESFSLALKTAPDLWKFFNSPHVKADGKRKLLQKIYQERKEDFYEILLNFFTILFEKSRFELIHEIAINFKKIADQAQGQGVAQLKTAVPISAGQEALIVSALERIAGYKITINKEVDPSLIGGVTVKVRNQIIDRSIKQEVSRLKISLKNVSVI